MNVSFSCPKCEHGQRREFDEQTSEIACERCGYTVEVPDDSVTAGRLHRCLVCPSTELFVRKDFNQRLGVTILVLCLGASCVTWFYHMPYATFGVLGATALLDALLYYVFVGNQLQCYRCRAEYRGVEGLERYEPFDLEIHERHRQQLIRLGKQLGLRRAPSSEASSREADAAPSESSPTAAADAAHRAGGTTV